MKLVIAATGASGTIYLQRLLDQIRTAVRQGALALAVASLFLGGGQGHTVTLPHLINGPPAALSRQGGVDFIAKFAPA